jgi:pimeloyl-ACP methyl ester carboxylesterase
MLIDLMGMVLVLLFRATYLGQTHPVMPWYLRLVSGLWLGLALWAAGALLQTWVPLWQAVVLGIAFAAIRAAVTRLTRSNVQFLLDLLAIAALAGLSVVPIHPAPVALGAVAFGTTGWVLDRVTRRLPRIAQQALLAAPLLLVAVLALKVWQSDDFGTRLWHQDGDFPLRLALVAPAPGRRITLPSGSVAWLLKNPDAHPLGLAILLHGNHPLASHQPAAVALQGALERSGYDVLSVDHPGYGDSPLPSVQADWRAWDPTIGPKEALAYARSIAEPTRTVVIGHSMGVDSTLQWLRDGADVSGAYVFGGSIDGQGSKDAWVETFKTERRVPCCLNPGTARSIHDRFYPGANLFAASLPAQHPPVYFVQFGIEYPDVAQVRSALYAAIPAPKAACDLSGVTHYFNTLMLWRFDLIDTATIIRTARLFNPKGAQDGCRL